MEDMKFTGLTLEELEAQSGKLLPPREEMQATIFSGPATNVAVVTQVTVPVNIMSPGGSASAMNSAEVLQAGNTGFNTATSF